MQALDKEGCLILTSAIPFSLKRKRLKRGIAFASLGILCLLPGIFLPPHLLSYWGLPCLLAALFWIGFGLLPYRRLQDIEKHPYTLKVREKETLFLSRKGRLARLPFEELKTLTYIDEKNRSGILIEMQDGETYFLPFFTKRSMEALEEYWNPTE